MAKSKTILVAAREIHGGTEKGGREVLKVKGELTPEAQKALGLKKDDVDALLAGGALIELSARASEEGDAELRAAIARAEGAEAALAAETERAEKAESDLAALQKQIDEAQAAAGSKGKQGG